MKGNAKVIEYLNFLLADELTAISQYMVHSEMCADWGYGELHEAIEKRAITEMKHAEMHIGRIIFLEGQPIVSNLNPLHIGGDVETQLKNDLASETGAVKAYNDGIRLTVEVGDNGTRGDARDDPPRRRGSCRLARDAARPDRANGAQKLSGRAGGLKHLNDDVHPTHLGALSHRLQRRSRPGL